MTSQRFVFVCGLHRSGTSLLHSILGAHPDASFFQNTGAPKDEGQHLQDVYPPARAHGGPGRFSFDVAAHLTETSPLVTEDNRRRLMAQWSRYWDTTKPLLIEKSPPNIIRSRFLQAMFPHSRFIFITRHPIAVSFATEKMTLGGVPPLPAMVEHWAQAHDIWLSDRQHLKHCLELRYEELVDNPAAVMQRLADFLQVAPWPLTEKIERGLNENYFRKWEAYRAAQPQEAQRILAMGKLPAQFGYAFDAPYVSPSPTP